MTALFPVSYTHLDVYKRQHYNPASFIASLTAFLEASDISTNGKRTSGSQRPSSAIAYFTGTGFGSMNKIPVSYTHLDVYKRQ